MPLKIDGQEITAANILKVDGHDITEVKVNGKKVWEYGTPPVITKQPRDLDWRNGAEANGDSVTKVSVGASASVGTLNYQWYGKAPNRNEIVPIPGATSPEIYIGWFGHYLRGSHSSTTTEYLMFKGFCRVSNAFGHVDTRKLNITIVEFPDFPILDELP